VTNMDGYKTYIAGAMLILIGIAGAVLGFVMPGSEHAMDANTAVEVVMTGLQMIGLGFGLVGLRHALNKAQKYFDRR